MVTPIEQRNVVPPLPPVTKVQAPNITREFTGEQLPLNGKVNAISPEDSYSGTLPDGSSFKVSWKLDNADENFLKSDSQETSGSLNFEYNFHQTSEVNGKEKKKFFKAEFNYEGTLIRDQSKKEPKPKEDILSFVRRLIAEVSSGISDKARTVKGVNLRKEDIAQLLGYDENKLAEKVFEIIHIASITKQMQRKSTSAVPEDQPANPEVRPAAAAAQETEEVKQDVNKATFTIQPSSGSGGQDMSDYSEQELSQLLKKLLNEEL